MTTTFDSSQTAEIARREFRAGAVRLSRSILSARIVLLVLVILAWQFVPPRFPAIFSTATTSSPSDVVLTFVDFIGSSAFWEPTVNTFMEFIIGYIIGCGLAIVLALALVGSSSVYKVIEPYLMMAFGFPKISLGPVIIIIFGIGIMSKILLAGILAFFLVFVTAMQAMRDTPDSLVNSARMLGATRFKILRKVYFPWALPATISAMRTSVPLAMAGAVLGEYLGTSSAGLGVTLFEALALQKMGTVFTVVIIIMLLVLSMMFILTKIERTMTTYLK